MAEQPGMSNIGELQIHRLEELHENTEELKKRDSAIVQAEKDVQEHLNDEHCDYYKDKEQRLREERKQLLERDRQIREQLLIERQSLIPTDLGEPQPKKPREYAINEEHFQVTLAHEQKPVATFYLVDANYPIRLQIYEENLSPLSDMYNFTDLCSKLQPPSISKGSYHIIKAQPRVYLYTYETTLPASKAKLDDFLGNCHRVPSKKILPPYQSTQVHVFCLTQFTMYDKRYVKRLLDSSNRLVQIVREHRSPPLELIEEITKCGDALDLFHDSEGQQEVAINATLINVLRKSIFISKFEVQPFSIAMSSLNICKYAASRQDIVIYHREKYIQKGCLNAAFISFDTSGEEEIESEEETEAECAIVGSAFKVKLSAGSNFGQLAANKLKLAADLCVQCIKGGNVLIKEIKIYGALIDVQNNEAKPDLLQRKKYTPNGYGLDAHY